DRGLRALDGLGQPGVLDGLVLLHAEGVHQLRDPVAREDAHQVVFQGQVELGRARVALAARTAPELLSMRRDSWRSVPRMCRPPIPTTSSCSFAQCSLYF